MGTEEVRSKLETLLREKYVNRANVSIVVKEFANKPVTIVGAVEKPGSLPISGRWTLLQAISAAGGLAPNGRAAHLRPAPSEDGLSDTLEIETDDLFQQRDGEVEHPDPSLRRHQHPGEIDRHRFLLGEVKSARGASVRLR